MSSPSRKVIEMRNLVAAVLAGLTLLASLAPAASAKRPSPPSFDPPPAPCFCDPGDEIM
jgi:hypothetical protein